MPLRRTLLLSTVVVVAGACAPRGPAPVSPAEVDELAARVEREPANGPLQLRYAAALRAADRCDEAMVAARRGMGLAPANALGPLVVGECLEAAGRHDDAVAVYREFLAATPEGPGVGAVRARQMLALRAGATAAARQALAREAELSQQPADPQTLAVLPVQIVGDSTYQPLSRGLAQMLTSDLALLERFRLVERMRLGALMDEMALSQTERVDPATAARVGRLVQAGSMVQGLAMIRSEQDARIEASVVRGTSEVTDPTRTQGGLRDLLQLEKNLVVGLAERLGYTLSDAERQAILENGTQNLAAFLAYSRALEAEDRGDYQAAAGYYREAVQADPGFSQAQDGLAATEMAPDVQAADVTDTPVLAGEGELGQAEAAAEAAETVDPVTSALDNTTQDLAPTVAEMTQSSAGSGTAGTTNTNTATGTTAAQPPPPSIVPPATVIGTIRIIFRLP
jgi:tetratricopeptide (TPR) repeat protein